MAKSDKEKKVGKTNPSPEKPSAKKESSKPKKAEEDDDDDDLNEDLDETTPKKAGKSAASAKKKKEEDDDDDDSDVEDTVDEWEKVEEEEEWDPDFDEFDIPKSKGKKATGAVPGKKGAADDDDDLKIDDEFKDMFGDGDGLDDEEDDY
jgi:hypothetical protein